MAGVNKVILVGNLGQDPEIRYVSEDRAVANFNLATSETFRDKEGNLSTRTEWHRLVFWGKLAKRAEQYLHKGSQIYVEGSLRTRSWEDKDGVKKYTTEVYGDKFLMLDKRSGDTDTSNTEDAG